MEKSEWYTNRILWKANQHRLLEKRCLSFDNLNASQLSTLAPINHTGKRLLVFYESADLWTMLTSNEVISFFDGKLHTASLDDIGKNIQLVRPKVAMSDQDAKKTACFIHIKNIDDNIWVPEGEELFAMMNILRMFPLSLPCINNHPQHNHPQANQRESLCHTMNVILWGQIPYSNGCFRQP